jgi:hypothetical protein
MSIDHGVIVKCHLPRQTLQTSKLELQRLHLKLKPVPKLYSIHIGLTNIVRYNYSNDTNS